MSTTPIATTKADEAEEDALDEAADKTVAVEEQAEALDEALDEGTHPEPPVAHPTTAGPMETAPTPAAAAKTKRKDTSIPRPTTACKAATNTVAPGCDNLGQ
jgi:hypothetical protein